MFKIPDKIKVTYVGESEINWKEIDFQNDFDDYGCTEICEVFFGTKSYMCSIESAMNIVHFWENLGFNVERQNGLYYDTIIFDVPLAKYNQYNSLANLKNGIYTVNYIAFVYDEKNNLNHIKVNYNFDCVGGDIYFDVCKTLHNHIDSFPLNDFLDVFYDICENRGHFFNYKNTRNYQGTWKQNFTKVIYV